MLAAGPRASPSSSPLWIEEAIHACLWASCTFKSSIILVSPSEINSSTAEFEKKDKIDDLLLQEFFIMMWILKKLEIKNKIGPIAIDLVIRNKSSNLIFTNVSNMRKQIQKISCVFKKAYQILSHQKSWWQSVEQTVVENFLPV